MNTIIEKQKKGIIKPSGLDEWLISHGVTAVTTEECAHLLGVPQGEVSQRIVGLQAKGRLVSIARGLWVAVPTESRRMGAPEPIRYMNALMDHYHCTYCVGWLSAASLHGASHQAPQIFQVAANKMLRDRVIGRSRLQFFQRGYVTSVSRRRVSTSSGSVMVASPGATMLMISSDLKLAGGIDNAATVIVELAEQNRGYMEDVLDCASLFSDTAVCRLGWILEYIVGEDGLDELAEYCDSGKTPSFLSPYDRKKGTLNKRWNLVENREIEADI